MGKTLLHHASETYFSLLQNTTRLVSAIECGVSERWRGSVLLFLFCSDKVDACGIISSSCFSDIYNRPYVGFFRFWWEQFMPFLTPNLQCIGQMLSHYFYFDFLSCKFPFGISGDGYDCLTQYSGFVSDIILWLQRESGDDTWIRKLSSIRLYQSIIFYYYVQPNYRLVLGQRIWKVKSKCFLKKVRQNGGLDL